MEKSDGGQLASSSGPAVPSEATGKFGVKTEEVRSISLGSIGAVTQSVGRVLARDDTSTTMPPASQTRTRTDKAVQGLKYSVQGYQQQSDRHLASQESGYIHFQPGRRSTTFTSHPPLRPSALQTAFSTSQRKVRNSTSTMDYMPSPDSFCTPDYLKSTFNPSPSSLYMYDQDHQDMRASFQDTTRTFLGPVSCAVRDVTTLSSVEPEFDLHPQYENSNNLEGFLGAVGATAVTHTESSLEFQSESIKPQLMTVTQLDLNKLKPGPTVTELNVDPYLFEDSGNVTALEREKLQTVSTTKMVRDTQKETAAVPPELGTKTFTPLTTVKTSQSPTAIVRMLQQSQSSPTHASATSLSELLTKSRTHNVAAVSPKPTTTIKTEPEDTDSISADGNPCLHNILTSTSQQQNSTAHVRSPTSQTPSLPSRGVEGGVVGGQSRPPSLGQQGKSGSVEEKWKEIEKFIHDPNGERQPQPSASGSAMDRKRKRHGSGESTMSDEESVKSQRLESVTDYDSDSDDDSDVSDTPFEESLTELAKRSKQYFWQYNIQAKGPKGTRLRLTINDNDPHHPGHFEDPVFDPTNTSLVGIRHAGKARKGDGNEITPNPRKLYMIGQKLCRLNREINNVQMASNLPASVRSKSRKEKNKLSSRACRLKKKAQHEANKIKLFGLNCEQGELLEVVRLIWPTLRERAKQQMKENIPFLSNTLALHISSLIKSHNKTKVAGSTADYVNQVVAKVEDGDPAGGLAIKLKPVKVKS